MRLDRRGIDEQFGGWAASRRQSVEDARPDAFGCPSLETIVERFSWTIDWWCILPPAAGYQDMHDAADHPAIIDAGLAPGIPRKMRPEPGKLGSRQPEISVIQTLAPPGDLESQHRPFENPFYGSQP